MSPFFGFGKMPRSGPREDQLRRIYDELCRPKSNDDANATNAMADSKVLERERFTSLVANRFLRQATRKSSHTIKIRRTYTMPGE